MNISSFEKIINEAWDNRNKINSKSSKKILNAISKTIESLDSGDIRVAEKKNNKWVVNQWIKKAIILSFRVNKMKISKGPYAAWFDKVEGKTHKWNEKLEFMTNLTVSPYHKGRSSYLTKIVQLVWHLEQN